MNRPHLRVNRPYLRARAVPVLYVDIDGTVREGKDDALGRFVNGPEDVRVFPEAVIMLKRWKAAGGRIVAVTNQGGIALGIVSVDAVRRALDETNRQCEFLFDLLALCIHHPDAKTPEMARCWCRKPSPGLIIEGAHGLSLHYQDEYYPPHLALMVGDREEDRICAATASVDFLDAAKWRAQAVN